LAHVQVFCQYVLVVWELSAAMSTGKLKLHLRRRRFVALLRRLAACQLMPMFCLVAYFGAATYFFRRQEGWSYTDCLYFVVATLTTVGYGDMAPETPGGRMMTSLLALVGVAVIAQIANTRIMALSHGFLLRLERAASPTGPRRALKARTEASLVSLVGLLGAMVAFVILIGKHMLLLENWHDCVYFSVVTLTTVGFGDMVPSESSHRLWMSLLMMLGVPIFGAVMGSVAEALSSALEVGEDTTDEDRTSATLGAVATAALEDFRAKLHGNAAPAPTVQREDFLAYSLVQKGLIRVEDVWEAWDEFQRYHSVKSVTA